MNSPGLEPVETRDLARTKYVQRGGTCESPRFRACTGRDSVLGKRCGLILNQVGPVRDASQSSFIDFPASDGMPLSLDGTKAIHGVIALTGAHVGLAEVDVTLGAVVGGQPVTIGTATGSAVLDLTGNDTPVPFAIQPNVSLDGSDVQALGLRV